jgi:hypothetical protein
MSLLDQGRENIVVYQQVATTDRDGNTIWKPSVVGTPTIASIQMLAQSGTSQRRAEQTNEGYETEETYRLRLPRSFPYILEAQAQIAWNGLRWSIVGKVRRYNGSSRTRHLDYMIRRA